MYTFCIIYRSRRKCPLHCLSTETLASRALKLPIENRHLFLYGIILILQLSTFCINLSLPHHHKHLFTSWSFCWSVPWMCKISTIVTQYEHKVLLYIFRRAIYKTIENSICQSIKDAVGCGHFFLHIKRGTWGERNHLYFLLYIIIYSILVMIFFY